MHHVAHILPARRIIEDGKLAAGLVYDESLLKTRRLAVTWLSANTWGSGSIYGTVEFSFPWKKIVAGKRFYWVEEMPRYTPSAYRILLTDSARDFSKWGLQPYEPASDRGPLRQRDGVWFWNGQYTSEFMVTADIELADCNDLRFVTHHPTICQRYKKQCEEKTLDWKRTGARIIAFLIGSGLKSLDHILKRQAMTVDHSMFDIGIKGILARLRDRSSFGGKIKRKESSVAVLKGALSFYGNGQYKSARELLKLLQSRTVFNDALVDIVNGHLGVTDWHLP